MPLKGKDILQGEERCWEEVLENSWAGGEAASPPRCSFHIKTCPLACAKKKSLDFASPSWWHLKVGMETPESDFQIYSPINDPRRAVCSLERGYRWGNIQKSFLGDNFWLECPTDLRSTPLSYIFNALFRDTPLGHVCRTPPNSQIAKLAKYLDIWLFGYLTVRKNHAQVGYPWKEHWKCSSEALTLGP